jgi:copper chaperone CopZ
MRKAKSIIRVADTKAPNGLENAKEAVSKIDGVYECEANHILQMLSVEYDEDRVTLDQIRRSVKRACN